MAGDQFGKRRPRTARPGRCALCGKPLDGRGDGFVSLFTGRVFVPVHSGCLAADMREREAQA